MSAPTSTATKLEPPPPTEVEAAEAFTLATSDEALEQRLRQNVIASNLAFSQMPALIRRATLLACNAEIACTRAGDAGRTLEAVTRELRGMADELQAAIAGVEDVFHDATGLVACWIESGRRVYYHELARRAIESEADTGVPPGALDTVRSAIAVLEREIEGIKAGIEGALKRLGRVLEAIDLIAVRKSQFIAVLAMTEAARVDDPGGALRTVAISIRELARQISEAAGNAQRELDRLARIQEELTLRKEGREQR